MKEANALAAWNGKMLIQIKDVRGDERGDKEWTIEGDKL